MNDPAAVTASGLSLGYDAAAVIDGLEGTWSRGHLHALIGANGCGKSTLLRGLSRLLPPRAGAVLLDQRDLRSWQPRALARELAMLPQRADAPEALTVRELIGFGRYPHRSLWSGDAEADRRAIDRAAAFTGVTALLDRTLGTLSGGQRQLAWIAMALAQEARTLLLDEPTSALDLHHQLDVLAVLQRLCADGQNTVVVVLHDVNLAARHADRIVAMRSGRVVAAGTPEQVLSKAVLREVFDVDAEILRDPRSGRPQCVAYRGEA